MNSADIQDSFLTVAEVAELLKLNQQTIRNWIDQGSLPAVRVGRRVRIRRSDLERVLADGYSAGGGGSQGATGPSAEDFWGGEAVGTPETPPVDQDPADLADSGPPSANARHGLGDPGSPSANARHGLGDPGSPSANARHDLGTPTPR